MKFLVNIVMAVFNDNGIPDRLFVDVCQLMRTRPIIDSFIFEQEEGGEEEEEDKLDRLSYDIKLAIEKRCADVSEEGYTYSPISISVTKL